MHVSNRTAMEARVAEYKANCISSQVVEWAFFDISSFRVIILLSAFTTLPRA